MYTTLILEGSSENMELLKKNMAENHPELNIIADIQSAVSTKALLARLQTRHERSRHLIIPTAHNNKISVSIADITYFEADGPTTIVHFKDKSNLIAFRILGYFKKMLLADHPFFLIHNSLLLNTEQIRAFDYAKLTINLTNGESLKTSRRLGKQFKKYWAELNACQSGVLKVLKHLS